jgi:hypothetical protein
MKEIDRPKKLHNTNLFRFSAVELNFWACTYYSDLGVPPYNKSVRGKTPQRTYTTK